MVEPLAKDHLSCVATRQALLFLQPDMYLFTIPRYEVKFQNGQDCGGAYIKLLSKDDKLSLVSKIISPGYLLYCFLMIAPKHPVFEISLISVGCLRAVYYMVCAAWLGLSHYKVGGGGDLKHFQPPLATYFNKF